LIRARGYSVPTRFKKASTVGSPQYPAAFAAYGAAKNPLEL
jgi:hypothetical protein